MWIAVIPAIICMVVLIFGVQEPECIGLKAEDRKILFKITILKKFPKPFWIVVASATFLTMARFSDAFLLLKARDVGMSLAYIPVVLVVMNFTYTFSAYPMGVISDRMPRNKLLGLGIVTLIIANCILAIAGSVWTVMLGTAIWGLHMGITQGLLATIITDKAPAELRGTAYGIFNLACGIGMLFSSVAGGVLWDGFGAYATFLCGAVFAVVAWGLLKIK